MQNVRYMRIIIPFIIFLSLLLEFDHLLVSYSGKRENVTPFGLFSPCVHQTLMVMVRLFVLYEVLDNFAKFIFSYGLSRFHKKTCYSKY